jgi:hypothetical protein
MPSCKFCNTEIDWVKVGDSNVPKNKDGTDHKPTCGKTSTPAGAENKAKKTRSTEERVIDLEAFIATCANHQIAVTGTDSAQVWCRL